MIVPEQRGQGRSRLRLPCLLDAVGQFCEVLLQSKSDTTAHLIALLFPREVTNGRVEGRVGRNGQSRIRSQTSWGEDMDLDARGGGIDGGGGAMEDEQG